MFTNNFIFNPLEQFEIFSLFTIFESISSNSYTTLTFTNSTFFIILNLAIFLFIARLLMLNNNGTIMPNRWQYIFEAMYQFLLNMVIDNIGAKSQKYFSIIFTLFTFLLVANLSGMIPYSFTITSHIIITFWLALSIFIGVTIIGIRTHKINFLSLFLPAGAPLGLAPLLVFIEILSYFIRVISLSVRLFANMMSGHILLKVLLGFAWTMMTANQILYIVHFLPLFTVYLLLGLEIGVAMIQAYVFAILSCIYLNDSINLH
jgi:F-type H+-transporting ATPase subunit a